MASFFMWVLIAITIALIGMSIFIYINTMSSNRDNQSIFNHGIKTLALITKSAQHSIQKVDGYLTISLTVKYSIENKDIFSRKDILIKVFDIDKFKTGQFIPIRYVESEPSRIIVLGDVKNF